MELQVNLRDFRRALKQLNEFKNLHDLNPALFLFPLNGSYGKSK